MRVAIASGKGGTGKTVIATNLAWLLAHEGLESTYLDCDVEAPNGHLFLKPTGLEEQVFTVRVPKLATETCSGCGECQAFCAFNAILALGDKVLVFNELCHACGGCMRVCPEGLLHEVDRPAGVILRGLAAGARFIAGRINVGEPRAEPLVSAVIREAPRTGVVVTDAPPGTSCSAVAAVQGADRVLLVTEPTPFGLHDLKMAVAMCRTLGCEPSAVINRSDLGNNAVKAYLEAESIPLVAEIPFDSALSEAYALGELAVQKSDVLHRALRQIITQLRLADIPEVSA